MDATHRKAPLQGHYWLTALFVSLALLPDLILSTGLQVARPSIAQSLHSSIALVSLGETLSNAGWAFGAVLAAFLALRFPSHILNVIYGGAFIVGCACGALAQNVAWEIGGRVLQGTATGMLLVSTLPPLIRSFSERRLKSTATIIDIAFFGAVAAGPIIGGAVAVTGSWRWLFAAVGLMACVAVTLAYLIVERAPGFDPSFPFDALAVGLAAIGALLAFLGMSFIEQGGWTRPQVWAPTTVGVACIVALVIYQYRREDALMPVNLLTTTYPLMGILTGVIGGLAFTSVSSVALIALMKGHDLSPLAAGVVCWPALVKATLAALLFGAIFNTRYALLLPVLGMLTLIAGTVLAITAPVQPGCTGMYLWITALLGLGAGLTVAPGLFMASLSVQPQLVGRAFALVELLRLAGAYAFVPVFSYLAVIYGTQGQALAQGVRTSSVVTLVILVVTVAVATAIFFWGGARIHAPDLRAYLRDNESALESPPMVGNPARPDASETLKGALLSVVEPVVADTPEPEAEQDSADPSAAREAESPA